jgi:choline dehydrogenase
VGGGLVGVFARTRPELADPDIQLHFTPWSTEAVGTTLHPFPGFSVVSNQSRPQSRGRLRLKSPNARDKPSLLANYLAEEIDRTTAVASLKLMRRIAGQPALQPWIAEEINPGPAIDNDEELLAYTRQVSGSIYHPVGTCKMGSDHDPMAVVDERLRLRGVPGLRVADASIMPQVVSGNTNACCIMIGEKAAAMISEDRRAA